MAILEEDFDQYLKEEGIEIDRRSGIWDYLILLKCLFNFKGKY